MIFRSYRCPDCEGVFENLQHRDEPPPSHCKLCGSDMAADTEALPSRVNFSSVVGKSGDQVYRQMEESSAYRAELAAEHLGVAASELSGMKVTNIQDRMREGDMAVVAPPANPVNNFMKDNRVGGLIDQTAGAEYARAAHQGPHAGAGSRAQDNIKLAHSRVAPQVAAAGQMGSYKG